MPTPFTSAEFEARQSRTRTLMRANGLDGLFVTDPGNLFYFTGYPISAERSFPRPAVFVLPLEGEPVLVAHDFYFPFPWQGTLVNYQQIGVLPVDLVASLLAERCDASARIGAELGHEQHLAISHDDFVALDKSLPNMDFVDAAEVFWQLRMVKTATEVTNIAEACAVHDHIFAQCFSDIRMGMTTREIELLFQHAAIAAGGRGSGAIVCVGPFDESQAAGSSAANAVLEQGTLCWIDFSLGWNGYRTDYCRAVVGGGPSAEQRRLWAKVHDVLLAGRAAAQPGNPVSAICKAQLDAAQYFGLDMSTWMARRYGHGSGIHTTEPPSVSLDDNTVLEPNMVIHLEPGVIGTDGIYVREDMIVITDNGCRPLSNAPWELGTA